MARLRASLVLGASSHCTHGSLGAPVASPTCTGTYEVYTKAGSPRETGGGDEWRRCDSCQRIFRDGMSSSSLLCPTCRARSPYDIAAGSYASSKDLRRRSGRKKKLTALPHVRQSSPEEVKDPFQLAVTRDGQYTVRSLPKHLISQYSNFCYEKKGRGERCVLCVSQPGVELWWGYNGSVIYQGKENCIEFQLSDRTAGIYLCCDTNTHRLLLVHIVFIKEEGSRHQPLGSCPQLPGEDQLYLPCDLECLSDACTDNNPVVCRDCASRGTIFLPPQEVQEFSPFFGEAVTLRAPVCKQELSKFRFLWICNTEELPSQDPFYCTFEALGQSYCFCIALNPSSNNKVYSSRLFIVEPKKATSAMLEPLTDPTVRTEVTPSQTHRVPSHPSPTQLACTSTPPTSRLFTPRTPSSTLIPAAGQPEQGSPSTIFCPVLPAYRPVVMHSSCVQRHPPQSAHDSEPQSMPSAEPQKVDDFLRKELLTSNVFRDPDFSLSSLAHSPSCRESIKSFIQMVELNFPDRSARQTVERVARLICQETTMEVIRIRRCTVLAYELILSLQEDERNPYHQVLGAQLMQRAPFPPMLLKWTPGQSQCLPHGEFVTLSVTAANADRYEWIRNDVSVGYDADYYLRVDPSTCGDYRCLVHNRHGTVETPPISISMNDEPTSSSVTEAWCEATYRVGITPGPSTEVAPVEADQRTVYGSHAELVVGNFRHSRSETDQVVPSLQSGDDSRSLMMPPSRRDLSAFHHLMPGPRGRAPVEPRLPHVHGSAFYSEYRPPPYSRPH